MRYLIVYLALALSGSAATLDGNVIEAGTGKPIAGARLRLELVPAEAVYAKTDDAGHFQFGNLAPGTYTLRTQGLGYLQSVYSIQVANAATARHTPVVMTRAAIIAGTITDSEGLPAPRAGIEVFTARPARPGDANQFNIRLLPGGQTALVESSNVMADDRGQYRCPALAPGTYYVMVKRSSNPRELVTYYPGVRDISAARPVVVEAGRVLQVNLRMEDGPGARVAGRATLPAGKMAPPGSYLSVQLSMASNTGAYESVPFAQGSGRAFELRSVSPGTYTVTAILLGAGDTPWSQRPNLYGVVLRLTVADRDIEGLDIALQELPPISGFVTFAAGCAPVPVRLSAAWASADVGAEGKFEFKGMRPDHTLLNVYPESRAVYATSALLGDREVLRDGFDYPVPAGTTLRIYLECANKGARQ